MKPMLTFFLPLFLLAPAHARAEEAPVPPAPVARGVEVTRNGSQPSTKGPADHFTGSVRIDPLFRPEAPSALAGASVTFEPGARTAWHTHPRGQVLVVTAGSGWVQQWGGRAQEIRPGDVVRIPPGQKHWHGAAATTALTHVALQEQVDGKTVEWLEKVSDGQYQAATAAR
jgi:quercetin dioxygenase-like cupin family protein